MDSTYFNFKTRVAERQETEYSVCRQYRAGTGMDLAVKCSSWKLVDRIGGLEDAPLARAARMAKITDYRLREYPDRKEEASI